MIATRIRRYLTLGVKALLRFLLRGITGGVSGFLLGAFAGFAAGEFYFERVNTIIGYNVSLGVEDTGLFAALIGLLGGSLYAAFLSALLNMWQGALVAGVCGALVGGALPAYVGGIAMEHFGRVETIAFFSFCGALCAVLLSLLVGTLFKRR